MPNRRAFLKASLLAGGLGWLSGCRLDDAVRGPAPIPLPTIDPDLAVDEVVGLRPFRRSGMRIEAETVDGRLIVHHYGHGGCGVTLSWGTARAALDLALAQPGRDAAVVGCGAVGLATARLFQEHGFAVRIVARDLPRDTTSWVSGALWAPSGIVAPEHRTPAFGARLAAAARYAHRRFLAMVGERYGVREVPYYRTSDGLDPRLSWEWEQTPELFGSLPLPRAAHPFAADFVHEFRALVIEPPIYLAALLEDFRGAGGSVELREFHALSELAALPASVVVNCTGLGAQALCADADLVPVKGQMLALAPQPRIGYAVTHGLAGLYLLPRRDGLWLGGSHQEGDWSLAPDPIETRRIFFGHAELFAGQTAARAASPG